MIAVEKFLHDAVEKVEDFANSFKVKNVHPDWKNGYTISDVGQIRPAPEGGRKLLVCVDGTWASGANQKDVRSLGGIKDQPINTPTNVFKFAVLAGGARVIKNADPKAPGQLVYYHAGVSTERDKKDEKTAFWEGMFGNLNDHVMDAYSWLARTYREGDEIFAVGFSRGATIVRSLLGFIRHVGLAKGSGLNQDDLISLVSDAFKVYQQREDDEPAEFKQKCEEFRGKHCWSTVALKFLGVFDTVEMLDVPEYILADEAVQGILQAIGNIERNNFHDLRVTPAVEYAYHALAIDENRENFAPTLFEPVDPANPPKNREQRWFRGAHGNIGGGEFQSGLSDITLEWMAEKARSAGLDVAPVSMVDTILAPFTLMGVDGGDGADDQTEALARIHSISFRDPLKDNPNGTLRFGKKIPRDINNYVDSGIYFTSVLDESVFNVLKDAPLPDNVVQYLKKHNPDALKK
ncbi:hypothetical protein BJ742DRAFT_802984 [Cladochytrium replicatum]|nr:hypothetical protein BJ742DRAFT_802984 [Cladochytrium replicatum]